MRISAPAKSLFPNLWRPEANGSAAFLAGLIPRRCPALPLHQLPAAYVARSGKCTQVGFGHSVARWEQIP
jgi:hypothetical protein